VRLSWRSLAAALLVCAFASAAAAQDAPFSPESLSGVADLRLTYAAGERNWLDGGFGKTSVAGDGLDLRLGEAALEWKPRFNFVLSGVVTANYQPHLDPAFDVGEAYLKFQGPPGPNGRLSLRAGVFWPPISQEHEGIAWIPPDMLTGSAINSWVGEEVKVGGLEATVMRRIGEHEVNLTGAVFGWNDTSGTLLSFRGWSLHGVRTGLKTDFQLPPLTPFMTPRQAPITTPFYELDGRAGYYGRIEWRPPAPFSVNALYYDNAGDRIAVEEVQWAWETRFVNAGFAWEPDAETRISGQAMTGETLMGYRAMGQIWVDVGFSSAFLLAQREVGENRFSGRVDWFETRDRTLRELDDNNEQGWALTAAWRRRLNPHMALIVEALHVSSERAARVLAGAQPKQAQTVLQSALRFSF